MPEHALITHLAIPDRHDVRALIERVERCLEERVARIGGEHDGAEFGSEAVVLYTYGPDADALLTVIVECLSDIPLGPGSYALKRYGPASDPAAREQMVLLDSP
jgi:hypothetical protein